ncbi:hypothetical protein N7540_004076 [Penicillium herquei]|nr:hypothetical protein N7540_004076 [Penicillium herquei]
MDQYLSPDFRKPDEQAESHDLNTAIVESCYTYRNSSQFEMMPSFFGTSPVGGAIHTTYPPSHFNTFFGTYNSSSSNNIDAFPEQFAATQGLWSPNTNDPAQVEPPASSGDKNGSTFGCHQEAQKK